MFVCTCVLVAPLSLSDVWDNESSRYVKKTGVAKFGLQVKWPGHTSTEEFLSPSFVLD